MKFRFLLLETLLIFCVFFAYGAYTAPDVNEAHYIGKAAHFWNPEGFAPGDFFLSTPEAHTPFFFTFGWLTLFFSLETTAWIGRIIAWGMLAGGWVYLVRGVVPRWGAALLSAVLFTGLMQYGALAGEWVIGGVEGKSFAYGFIFWALGDLVRNRWNRAWILLGFAAMFHVVVGGWAIIAAGFAWMMLRTWDKDKKLAPPLKSMLPALAISFVLTLPALIPTLMLNADASAETIRTTNRLQVFDRLAHHLLLSSMVQNALTSEKVLPRVILYVFGGMIIVWNFCCCRPRFSDADLRMRMYVYGVLAIFAAGWAINLFAAAAPDFTASLLRFYFFRLADAMLPLGCAIMVVQMCLFPAKAVETVAAEGKKAGKKAPAKNRSRLRGQMTRDFPRLRKVVLTVLIAAAVCQFSLSAKRVLTPAPPRSCAGAAKGQAWRDVCEAARRNTLPGETFMVPYNTRTFTWYSRRNVVAVWKDMPQDAQSVAEWWSRIHRLYYGMQLNRYGVPTYDRIRKFSDTPPERFPRIAKDYGVKYVVGFKGDMSGFPEVYRNETFSVWRIDGEDGRWRVTGAGVAR